MRDEENICQYCTRQRAITTLWLNAYLNKMYQELHNVTRIESRFDHQAVRTYVYNVGNF